VYHLVIAEGVFCPLLSPPPFSFSLSITFMLYVAASVAAASDYELLIKADTKGIILMALYDKASLFYYVHFVSMSDDMKRKIKAITNDVMLFCKFHFIHQRISKSECAREWEMSK
jgi:hypothetical protein